MWSFASNARAANMAPKNGSGIPGTSHPECSDDDVSSCVSREEGLECPICWESFNIVENVPYVLWCGHTLCKNCVLSLQSAVVRFQGALIQLPLFISCPWCHLLSFRLVYKGNLKFPRKNFFLLWMVESKNSGGEKGGTSLCGDHQQLWQSSQNTGLENHGHHHHSNRRALRVHPEQLSSSADHLGQPVRHLNIERIKNSLRKSLIFFVGLTAKFPLVMIFLIIVLYVIPASAAVLLLYMLVTVLLAFPSFLMLYFAYTSLDWLIREIIS